MGLNIRLGSCPGTGVRGKKVVSKKLSNGSGDVGTGLVDWTDMQSPNAQKFV